MFELLNFIGNTVGSFQQKESNIFLTAQKIENTLI